MYLNYAKINSKNKRQPMLRLQTLAGKELGVVPYVHDLRFCVNFSEISTIEFTVPFQANGMLNPLYAALSSYKVIYTDDLGIYVLESPSKSGDGIQESKEVRGYSLERLFSTKMLFIEEGTYNFWDPADSRDTVLGRVIELDPSWSVGYVAPRLIGCYRTFDQFDSDALSFCYGDAMEKYRCAFVFDVYERTINVYDATENAETLPIYLSYHNLVQSVDVEELADDIATKLHVSGSDGLTIRDVNPTGKDYIVNLDYFLSGGDLDVKADGSSETLADRVREWEAGIASRQSYYTGLSASRASLTARKLTAESDLTELKGELDGLEAQQSVTIQGLAMEITEEGKRYQQDKLDEINEKIAEKKGEIQGQKSEIEDLERQIQEYKDALVSVNQELAFESFFTQAEQKLLNPYMIEDSVSDETFVATDVDTSVSGAVSSLSGAVRISDSKLTKVELPSFQKEIYTVAGGTVSAPDAGISAEVMRGTFEVFGSGYFLTAYLGKTDYNGHSFSSGLITISGTLSRLESDVSAHTEDEVTEYRGTWLSFQTEDAKVYFTVSVSDYQKYSVEMELYDFGEEILDDYAWPVYEFSVDSANFLYHEAFEPFKNKLELGKAVHLSLGSEGRISAKIIGFELDFEDISKFSLVFSNRYQKKNGMEKWLNEVKTASRSSRSINASKYIYNRAADKVTEVSEVMRQRLVAAANNIVNKEDQTVLINGSGINIGGKSKYQMRLVDNMIAMTDDGWKTAKLAIGLFATKDVGTQWGVNAELIAGNLLIGNKLVLQAPNDKGYMSFQVDETGAWLYNSTFVLQSGKGGQMLLCPEYGVAAGPDGLYTTSGTTVLPSFIDSDGDIIFDKDGFPKLANFYIDPRDGTAYFRGNVYATDGVFNGTVYAKAGEFDGIIKARDIRLPNGDTMISIINSKGKIDADWLDLYGINVKNKAGKTVMTIDENGLRFGAGYSPIVYQFSTSLYGPWHDDMEANDKYRRDSLDGGTTWGEAYQFRGTDGSNGSDANVTFSNIKSALQKAASTQSTFITADSAGAPNIYGGKIYGAEIYGGKFISLGDGVSNGFSIVRESGSEIISLYKDGSYAAIGGDYNLKFVFPNQTESPTYNGRKILLDGDKVIAVFG